MLKISDFSRLTQTPAKTLRFYDDIGLFKPAQVDPWTGYRYYSPEQLPRLNRILALKGLGLSLDQIKRLLDEGLSAEQIRGMLKLRQAEILQNLDEEQTRLRLVEARLQQIEREGKMSEYDVILKNVEPVRVAGIRGIAPSMADFGATFGVLFGKLGQYLMPQDAIGGPALTLYHDQEFTDHDLDVEAAFTLGKDVPETAEIKVHTLPAATVAATVHRGGFEGIGLAYEHLMRWVSENGYHLDGPAREVYLSYEPQNPAKNVTEIQLPVVKG